MKKRHAGAGRPLSWLTGNIRRKLTLFVALLCALLIGLVWLVLTQLLQPVYRNTIRADLERTATTLASLLQEGYDQQLLYYELLEIDGVVGEYFSMEFVEEILNPALREGRLDISERSLDIGDANFQCRFYYDTIGDSILHPVSDTGFWGSTRLLDTAYTLSLREHVLRQGSLYYLVNEDQMVVGITAVDGRFSVMVAANLERTGQSMAVLRSLMWPLSALLVLVAVVGAWLLGGWFTKPLRRLSLATQEVARGNYAVQVPLEGRDEFTRLAGDFNTMAREVGRSAALQRDLLANVSHDLRTPLTLIKGYAETVRDLSGDDPALRVDQLNVIVDEADRLSALVGRVLELSRVSSGSEKPRPVRFDLAQLCDEVAYRYDDFCTANGCRLEFCADGPADVLADPELLERALHNLLGNALAHVGSDGYVGLRVLYATGGRVRVEVEDHGPGIPPEDLPHIFDRYYRSRADTGKPGTGLGLSITKAILEAHTFTYGVDSQLGSGARFWFEGPLAPPL